jgi:hypothetical protein
MITRWAYASKIATSAGLADFTGRSLSVVVPSVDPPLRVPNKMLINERPMACAINRVSSVPAEPTSVPATSNRMFSSR